MCSGQCGGGVNATPWDEIVIVGGFGVFLGCVCFCLFLSHTQFYSGHTPDVVLRNHLRKGLWHHIIELNIEPRSATYKVNTFHTLLSLQLKMFSKCQLNLVVAFYT